MLDRAIKDYIMSFIEEFEGEILRFKAIHDEIITQMNKKFDTSAERTSFCRSITQYIQRKIFNKSDIQLLCRPGSKRSIGLKFLKPKQSESGSMDSMDQDGSTVESEEKPMDYVVIGKSIDRYVQKLKKRINDLEEQLQEKKEYALKRAKQYQDTINSQTKIIENLNERIASQNQAIQRLRGNNTQKDTFGTMKFSDIAKTKPFKTS